MLAEAWVEFGKFIAFNGVIYFGALGLRFAILKWKRRGDHEQRD